MEQTIRNRGDTEFTYADFEAMPYTIAVIKVSCSVLHFHFVFDDPMQRKRSGFTLSRKSISSQGTTAM
jgi:hypothetical protein